MKKNKKERIIDLEKTLEQLENDFWTVYQYETSLIEKCHNYRKIKLKDLSIENLRLLIGQNIGNKYLIPLCIEKLEKNILIEGGFFEGDILLNVLRSDRNYWINNKDKYFQMITLIDKNLELIKNFDLIDSIKNDILSNCDNFKKINLKQSGTTDNDT